MNNISLRRAVPVAIVHHANQYLITDGYDNREGISRIVDGYVPRFAFTRTTASLSTST